MSDPERLPESELDATPAPPPRGDLDPLQLRGDFPILAQRVHGHPLVYLDSAASSQKPQGVIDAVSQCYERDYANVHRGVYELSQRATAAYEAGRSAIQRLLGAPDPREVILLRGTTEAINLVAASFGRSRVGPGDEVLVTAMEHHSNIVPWQMLCRERGAALRVAPVDDRGELLLDDFEASLGPHTRLVAVTHISNALGTINPVREIVERAHARGVPVLVDGAQATARVAVDVVALGCDFYTVSGHKMYGPSGIGALWGRMEHLEAMPPYQGGGEMIASVTFEETHYAPPPAKFEAGTPHIAGAVGLAAAVDYLLKLDLAAIAAHEEALSHYAEEQLREIPGLRFLGTPARRAGVISFVLEDVHAHDVGTILDHCGVAVRSGHHCAQPLMHRFGVDATTRLSFGVYNTREDVDAAIRGLHRVREVFR